MFLIPYNNFLCVISIYNNKNTYECLQLVNIHKLNYKYTCLLRMFDCIPAHFKMYIHQ